MAFMQITHVRMIFTDTCMSAPAAELMVGRSKITIGLAIEDGYHHRAIRRHNAIGIYYPIDL